MSRRVLVADDDRALQVLLNVLLTRAGFDVEFVADGREAFSKMRDGGDGYAVVMLDLILPGLSGVDILEELGKSKPDLLPRVIVVTGASRGVVEKIDASRIHAVLTKPFDIQDVIRLTTACADQT
jgi:DNA-binding response OmpR family regulator